MRSILVLCVVVVTGCAETSDGPTGGADLEAGPDRVAYSAWTEWNPTYTLDTNTALRGWAIFFSKAEPGVDCRQLEVDASQVIYIRTQQPATGQLGNVPMGSIPLSLDERNIESDPQATIEARLARHADVPGLARDREVRRGRCSRNSRWQRRELERHAHGLR